MDNNSGDPGYSGLRAGGVENELYLSIASSKSCHPCPK